MRKITLFFAFSILSVLLQAQPSFTWTIKADSLQRDAIRHIGIDKHNNIYSLMFGSSSGQSGYWAKQCWLNKHSADGVLLWKKKVKCGYHGWPMNMSVDRNDFIYLALACDTRFDSLTTAYDYLNLYKLNSNGNSLWNVKMKANPWNGGVAKTDGDGNTVLSCNLYTKNSHYDDSIAVINSDTFRIDSSCIVLARINASGQVQWHKIIETGAYPTHKTALNKNYTLVAGPLSSRIKIDNFEYLNTAGDKEFIALFDVHGTLVKFKTYKGNYYNYYGTYYANSNAGIYIDSLNNIFFSNYFQSYFTYGNTTIDGFVDEAYHWAMNSIVAKLDADLEIVWSKFVPGLVNDMNVDNSSGILINSPGHLLYKISKVNGNMINGICDNSENMCMKELSGNRYVIGGSYGWNSFFGDPASWNGYYSNSSDYYLISSVIDIQSSDPQAAFYLPEFICSDGYCRPVNKSVNAITYKWEWGDDTLFSSPLSTPQIHFNDTGMHAIKLIVCNEYGCDTIVKYIQVRPLPNVTLTAAEVICAPDSIISFQLTGSYDSLKWSYYSGYGHTSWASIDSNWQDTIHWGSEHNDANIMNRVMVYKNGCAALLSVLTRNPVPGYGTLFKRYDGWLMHNNFNDIPVQWYLNDEPIPGIAGNSYFPLENGTYKIRFGDSCYYFSNTYDVVSASVQNAVKNDQLFRIVPNPASSFFEIQCNEMLGRVEITDISGRVIYQEKPQVKNPTIACELSTGIYTVKIQAEKKVAVQVLLVTD